MIRFTKEEKTVLIAILVFTLIGTVVLYWKKFAPPTEEISGFPKSEMSEPEKIDINKAGFNELTKLKNIGPVLAERIIAYREGNGPFLVPEDIKKVKGIGKKKYEKIKDRIKVD